MATKSKATQQVKFEVGQLVEFNNRFGRVSRIAKNGAVYVSVLGETTVADQTREELRVKKADLQLVEGSQTIPPVAPQGCDKIEELVAQQSSVVQESIAPMVEPIQSALVLESTEPPADFSLQSAVDSAGESQSVALADAKHALRELTFSVTRHSILTAFIDVALNKNIPDYHHKVASNIKNLMAAAFDPVHDAVGYARIKTWMWAALELVVKNKDRVAKMLKQPIEAAPIKIDRVSKLGMWIDNMMNRDGATVNDMTSAGDSCYVYDAIGKKLEACTFVVVEVAQARANAKIAALPIPSSVNQEFCEHLTAQSAIAVRKQYIDYWRQLEPGLSSYCGIVPILKTGLSMQAAIEDTMADVIGSLK